jgi:cytochrome P450/NADPH-cytochrome P450 reductase
LGGEERVVIGSQALMNEVCNEDRFSKIIAAALKQARNGVHDGLGTAYSSQEPNWGIAHRTLAPHFGPLAIRSMFDEMHDIATQLVMKWTRQGPGSAIQVTDDFTRLTLDTIALCAMDYRFNSYYSERLNPFVEAMSRFLKVSGDRARRVAVSQPFHVLENHEYWGNIEILRETSRAIVNARKERPSGKKDMLGEMLHGVDPETGKPMTVRGSAQAVAGGFHDR